MFSARTDIFRNFLLQNFPTSIQEEDIYQHLDVSHPDSPYGLIQDVLSPKPSETKSITDLNSIDLGGLRSNEVWLSEGNLLVLKGNFTHRKSKRICIDMKNLLIEMTCQLV